MSTQANNPLHGLTLEKILTQLHEHYGWDGLARRIKINCFSSDPSIKSSLKFLRKTQWARDKVEGLYIRTFSEGAAGVGAARQGATRRGVSRKDTTGKGAAGKGSGHKGQNESTDSPSPWQRAQSK